MNKIYQSYHNIKLDNQSQQRILSHILQYEPHKQNKRKMWVPAMMLCCFVLIFAGGLYLQSIRPHMTPESPNHNEINNALPKDMTLEEAIHSDIYVDVHGTIYNQNILDDFLEDVNNNQESNIVIWHITDEGDPLITTVHFTPHQTTIDYDTTRDAYGEQTVKTYQFAHIGIFNDDLCAYNHELNLDAFENDDALYITTLHRDNDNQSSHITETFSHETYDIYPNIRNIVSYLNIAPQDVKILSQNQNEFVFCFYKDPATNCMYSIYQYVQLLEKQGYYVQQYDATISSTFELTKGNDIISITLISSDNDAIESYKEINQNTLENIDQISNENIICKITRVSAQ